MAKEGRFWFDHDYGARNDDKILELRSEFGAEGYGIFWMLIETMAEGDASINLSLMGGLSHGYGVAKAKLKEIIDFCIKVELFQIEANVISSKRVKDHKVTRQNFSEKGRQGAEKRWGKNSPPIATPMLGDSRGHDRTGQDKERGNETLTVFDAEKEITGNQIQFEKICMTTGKDAATAKTALRKFHLFLEEKQKYPQTRKQVFAGFERWLMDERNDNRENGTPGKKKMVI